MTERILRFPEVKAMSGLSRSSIYLYIHSGMFTRPILLGKRMVGWPKSEIAAICNARIRGASEDAMRELVVKLEAARANAV